MITSYLRALVCAALVAAGLTLGAVAPVSARPAASHPSGIVRGAIVGKKFSTPRVKMLWFTDQWGYLGSRRATAGLYSVRLPPGTYRLQFVDLRPTYDITRSAATDARVVVRAGRTSVRNIRMRRGAAITGRVQTRGGAGSHARIVAANRAQQSFETIANGKGEFALGGLPRGSYSLFTYDRKRNWVGKSVWIPHLARRHVVNRKISLNVRAGRMLVDLYAAGRPLGRSITVTVISRRTGQFWSARSRHGSVLFPALYPGRYRIIANGAGSYLGRSGVVRHARVRAGGVSFGSFQLTRRGARVAGTVVDAQDPSYRLRKARVLLYDRSGHKVGETVTGKNGRFLIGGQLTTQSGMVIVVNPDPGSGGWMQAKAYCKYRRAATGSFSIRTGRTRELGQISLSHQIASNTPPQCRANPPTDPTPTTDPTPSTDPTPPVSSTNPVSP